MRSELLCFNNHFIEFFILDTHSDETFRDIMDMLQHTTESMESLNASITECTDASNFIMKSINSTAEALDDIMKIMGDEEGERKELFTVYIPKVPGKFIISSRENYVNFL